MKTRFPLAGILLGQAPLVGVLAYWREQVGENLWATVALALLYEFVLAVLAFGKEVWRYIRKRAVKEAGEWIISEVASRRPGYARRYRRQIIQDYGTFNMRGLGLMQSDVLQLEDVFVELSVASTNPAGAPAGVAPSQPPDGDGGDVWEYFRSGRSRTNSTSAVVILGPPGSGKTTLVNNIAVTFARNRQRRHGARPHIPIVLECRKQARVIAEHSPSLTDLLVSHFGSSRLYPTLRPPDGWFDRVLTRGRAVVFLDGLDEVGNVEDRLAVSKWLDTQVASYSKCKFLVTSRPQGYLRAPLQRARVLQVKPFSRKRARRFIRAWYLATEAMSGAKTTERQRLDAERDSADLLRRLDQTPALGALMGNPLLLTMIAMVHRYRGALPGNRAELYSEICEVLLGRWRQSKGVEDFLSSAQKRAILSVLARHMMRLRVREILVAEAEAAILPLLSRVGYAEDAPVTFLEALQESSGLVLERETGLWGFAHLTFQEYLTSTEWLEDPGWKDDLRGKVGDSWWHETLRLMAAQSDASAIVSECLEVGTVQALTLASECLDEAREIAPEVRLHATEILVECLDSDDISKFRLAAEVALSRSLKGLTPLGEGLRISPGYVTNAEYQLCLDDLDVHTGRSVPDHWLGGRFARGEANAPAGGVSPEDATIFCSWLSQRYGPELHYRLPTLEEATKVPAAADDVGTWCQGPSSSLEELSATTRAKLLAALVELARLPLTQPQGGASLPTPTSLPVPRVEDLDSVHSALAQGRVDSYEPELSLARAVVPYFLALTGDGPEAVESGSEARQVLLRLTKDIEAAAKLVANRQRDRELADAGKDIQRIVSQLAVDINRDEFSRRSVGRKVHTTLRNEIARCQSQLRPLPRRAEARIGNEESAAQAVAGLARHVRLTRIQLLKQAQEDTRRLDRELNKMKSGQEAKVNLALTLAREIAIQAVRGIETVLSLSSDFVAVSDPIEQGKSDEAERAVRFFDIRVGAASSGLSGLLLSLYTIVHSEPRLSRGKLAAALAETILFGLQASSVNEQASVGDWYWSRRLSYERRAGHVRAWGGIRILQEERAGA